MAEVILREDALRRIIQFKCPSPRGQWRNQVERRRASVPRTSSRTGVLSALWSQSLCLGTRPGTLVLQGGEEKRATDGGRAIRNRTVLRFGLVVLFKGPDYPLSPRMHVPTYADRGRPSSRNMMIAGCYHLQ